MWWKQHKWKVLVPLVIVAVLSAAFFAGGDTTKSQNSPESEGSMTEEPSVPTYAAPEEQAAPSEDVPDASPEESAPQEVSPEEAPVVSEQPEMVIDPETGTDRYQTEPVPEGKPVPVEPQDAAIGTDAYTCTISISCATVLNNLETCAPEKVELVPEDGWILEPTAVTFYEGESVFNVLQRTCKQQKIHMEYMDTPLYNSAYIEGIHNLYEFDVGALSGWMYSVNGWFPNYGCSRYQLRNGDVVCWVYTCDLGEDTGGRNILDG